jgi:hypothetical protein
VKVTPVKRKRRACHQARRGLPVKTSNRLCDMVEALKRTQIMRMIYSQQYVNDATKTGKKAKP